MNAPKQGNLAEKREVLKNNNCSKWNVKVEKKTNENKSKEERKKACTKTVKNFNLQYKEEKNNPHNRKY